MRRCDAGYRCFADLAKAQTEGKDSRVSVRRRPGSSVAILAPHGGGIEIGTSEVARAVAGDDFSLYLFEGLRGSGNYAELHLTSHRFDEPRCLELLAHSDYVVAIHGCKGEGRKVLQGRKVLLGGLDAELKARVAVALTTIDVDVRTTDHEYPAREPANICNRGRRGVGVQIELTSAIRLKGSFEPLTRTIRSALPLDAGRRS
jgi:phage replication-related protein YjqB (UPF0714/DUF867 family)